MVVRVDGLLGTHLPSQELNRAVRDDLVGVHVRGGARARLEDVQHEVLVERAVHHLGGRAADRFRPFLIQKAEFRVHLCGCFLDRSERLNEPAPEPDAADGEVPSSPFRLCAVQHPRRNAHFTHRILLDPLPGRGLRRRRVLHLRSHRSRTPLARPAPRRDPRTSPFSAPGRTWPAAWRRAMRRREAPFAGSPG